tara:strand:+ start:290 stop:565 length:276 start_codon:yes stop_codon:yes gene_type:complete
MDNFFISLIKIKHIISLIINYINNDITTLYNISKTIRLYDKNISNMIDQKILKYNIDNVNHQLLSYILDKDFDMGSTILYRIEGMPLLDGD